MTTRERFLRAMRRQGPGYIPHRLVLTPPQLARFRQMYGHEDYETQWGVPIRAVTLPFRAAGDDFRRWHPSPPPRMRIDPWGIGHLPADDGSHFERLVHPLAGEITLRDLRKYPWPLPAGTADIQKAAEAVESIKGRDLVSVIDVAPVGGTIFWPAYKVRSMEDLLCDFLAEPQRAQALVDLVAERVTEQSRAAAMARPDIIHMADDLGTQISTYVGLKTFRQFIRPGIEAAIAAAREIHPGVLISFHSDGAIFDFIPDLIEMGVDILNPIQPECMDPFSVKERFGGVLSLYGCVGTQTVMPFGSAAEVRDRVRTYCDGLAGNGGLMIAPTHVLEPEVPFENILAFVETAAEYA